MAHYDKHNMPDLLELGDTVRICGWLYSVGPSNLDNVGGLNSAVFDYLGIENPSEFAHLMYGYKDETGAWPFYKKGDYAAATRLVRALLMADLAKKPAKKPAEKPAEKPIPDDLKPVAEALKSGSWGCQKDSVYKLVSAICKYDFKQ